MSDVVIGIHGDATPFNAEVEEAKKRKDALVRQWKIDRNTLMRQIREGFTMISSLVASFRQAMSLFGQQIDPFFSALIGMVLSTASMLISASTVLAMTGIGGAVAAVLFSVAVSFQILTIGKLLADKIETEGILDRLLYDFSQIQTQVTTPRGVGF